MTGLFCPKEIRKMKKLFALLIVPVLTVVLLFSNIAFAEDNGDDTLEILLSTMTLREKVAQMMIASFRVWQEVPETADGEQPAEEPPKTNMRDCLVFPLPFLKAGYSTL